ncbi:MAG: dephospho-CoA kinase [Clostridia bacterium]|nr:dephospho-CoA kinase [Clostridia bacterium]
MRVLGITGGTGTGKSMVSSILKKKGCEVIDADAITKDLQRKGCPVFNKIVECFGDGVVDGESGELDRKKLAKIVFGDDEARLKINAIVHTAVAAEIKRRLKLLEKRGVPYVVLDVPVPVENGFFDVSDVVWAVCANDDIRIERIMDRSGMTQEEAEARIGAQLSNREYAELADVVIDNEGTAEELEKLVMYEFERTVGKL